LRDVNVEHLRSPAQCHARWSGVRWVLYVTVNTKITWQIVGKSTVARLDQKDGVDGSLPPLVPLAVLCQT